MKVQQLSGNGREDVFVIRFDGIGDFFHHFFKTYPKSMQMTEQEVLDEVSE